MKRTVLLVATISLLAGCTVIPTSSSPEVVRTVPRASSSQSAAPDTGPRPGMSPSDVMAAFGKAQLAADGGHSQARQFLSTTASRKWQDDTTVILDNANVHDPVFSGDSATVTVTGRRVGAVDATGVFSPILKGTGAAADEDETFSYTLTRHAGQWRVDSLPQGTLISQSDFRTAYHLRKIYFFDPDNAILVPDLRYTSLEGQALATWLLQRLLAGPRPELAQSVQSDLPDQVGKAAVTIGDPTVIDLPGVVQGAGNGAGSGQDLNQIAAQLAFTIGQVTFTGGELQLTDSGRPVTIPVASGPTFSPADFSSDNPDIQVSGVSSYFLRDGVLYTGAGAAFTFDAGKRLRNLASVAIQRLSTQGVQLAAVDTSGRLVIGDPDHLTTVSLQGKQPTSRPEWSPQGDDAWIGAGSTIYRIPSGQAARPVSVTTPTGVSLAGVITTVRFSPDGVRVAVVIRAANGAGSVWVGSVVTSGSDVRIDSLQPITPPAMTVTDVAWADQTKLYLISAAPGGQAGVSELLSDGSQFASATNSGLPGAPTSITASPQQNPIVSANGLVVELDGDTWANIGNNPNSQPGIAPIYGS